ncbi:complement resistance protein TraT [Campylobacter iguaniorum]|uniref:complement resistance protein TraT n=1 Tax=Campylobacter iguaniorum TaxID=1244531 RepID=UPI003AADECF9
MVLNSKIILSSIIVGSLLAGCATTTLQTSAKMTQSIFLDPVAKDKKIIFVSIKNTSGHDVNLENKILQGLQNKGYTITDDPDAATYILMTNVLYCDKKSETNSVGSAVGLGATGAAISGYNGGGAGSMIAAGAAGAVVGGVLGKLTEDTIWQMQVDVNIRQKTKGAVYSSTGNIAGQATVRDSSKAGFLNAFGGSIKNTEASGSLNSNQINTTNQNYERDYVEKSTIIFAEATKMGLELPEATPILEDKVSSQVVGLF